MSTEARRAPIPPRPSTPPPPAVPPRPTTPPRPAQPPVTGDTRDEDTDSPGTPAPRATGEGTRTEGSVPGGVDVRPDPTGGSPDGRTADPRTPGAQPRP
ncbi:hypothetical protein EAO75_23940, partial [Streptomyces sp. uw30]